MLYFKSSPALFAVLVASSLAAYQAGGASPAAASIVTADASVAGNFNISPFGGSDTLTGTDALKVNAGRGSVLSGSSFEHRGMVEFAMPTLPAGATLNSATLFSRANGNTSYGDVTVNIYGYAGNNRWDSDDAFEIGNLLGSQTWIPSGPLSGTRQVGLASNSVALDVTGFVSTLLATGAQHAGFLFAIDAIPPPSPSHGFLHFAEIRLGGPFSVAPAQLILDYTPAGPSNPGVPEAASIVAWLGLGGCGATVAIANRRKQRALQ